MTRLLIALIALLTAHTVAQAEKSPRSEKPDDSETVVVCFGDSITAGKYPTYLNELLPAVKVVNAGVGGNTTGQGLARMDDDVLQYQPKFVLILFGTNDSVLRAAETYRTPLEAFETNLRSMVERCRARGAQPVLGTVLPIMAEPYYTRHPKEFYEPEGGLEAILERYRGVTLRIGKEWRVPVVDFYTEIAGDLTMLKPDGVHPNEEGLKTIANLFSEVVKKRTQPVARVAE